MRPITVNTKLIGLLGMPLGQSFSPQCQNAVYEEKGWDLCYIPIEVPQKDNFGAVVNGIRHMNFAGFAVTKPYKVEIMQYLDEIDDLAEKIGSCNTVVIGEGGKLKGYNTDGIGAIRSMEEEAGVQFEGTTFFSFGAGGTGKSVCLEIASRKPARIYISSRSELCEELAAHINRMYPGTCVAIRSAERDKVLDAVAQSDVLLNLSGLGMASHLNETPLDKKAFKPSHMCFDATYNPAQTLFLKEAAAAGCKTLNGLGMMVYQGTRQMKIWTGKPEPVESMLRNLKKIVGV